MSVCYCVGECQCKDVDGYYNHKAHQEALEEEQKCNLCGQDNCTAESHCPYIPPGKDW